MTNPDRYDKLNPPCTARTGVGVGVVVAVAAVAALLLAWWLLR